MIAPPPMRPMMIRPKNAQIRPIRPPQKPFMTRPQPNVAEKKRPVRQAKVEEVNESQDPFS